MNPNLPAFIQFLIDKKLIKPYERNLGFKIQHYVFLSKYFGFEMPEYQTTDCYIYGPYNRQLAHDWYKLRRNNLRVVKVKNKNKKKK